MMKYYALLWSALWRKPFRTTLAFLSIVIAFTLFGLLHGVASAMDGIIEQIAANRLRVQSLSGRGGVLPISYGDQIAKISGVDRVSGIVILPGYYRIPANRFVAVAIGGVGPASNSRGIQMSAADANAFARTKSGAIVHQALAQRFGWKLGDRIPFHSVVVKRDRSTVWDFELVGIYETRDPFLKDQLVFHYDYLDESRANGSGTVQSFSVISRDPTQNDAIVDAIDQRFANSIAPTSTQSEREWAMAGLEQAIDFNILVKAIIGSALFTLLLVTGNTMMESVRQRIPELAVLKTLGYPNATILTLVLVESGFLYLMGAGVGLSLSTTMFPLIGPTWSNERIPMPAIVILQGVSIAVAAALLSAAAPAMRAQRLSIVEALRRQ